MAGTAWDRVDFRDYGPGLPVSLPLVQSLDLWENPSAPLASQRGGRGRMDPALLRAGHAVDGRRCVYHSPQLGTGLCRRNETPVAADSIRIGRAHAELQSRG